MDLFSEEVVNAEVVDMNLPYVNAGKYKIKIDTLKDHSGFKGRTFLMTFEITKVYQGQDPIGRRCIWALKLDQPNTKTMNLSQIKKFMATALEGTPEELTNEDIDKVMSPENPLNGVEVGLDAYKKEGEPKIAGDPPPIYTNLRWIPLSELEDSPPPIEDDEVPF